MKLLTFYSGSHKKFFDEFFKPSFDKHLKNEFKLVVYHAPQDSTGQFNSKNWDQAMKRKIENVLDFLNKNPHEDHFVFADVDIIFFAPLKKALLEELGNYDIALQNDGNCLCAGFFICKVNNETKKFFENVIKQFEKEDQTTINRLLPTSGLKYKALSKKFFSPWRIYNGTFRGIDQIRAPEYPILMIHANWTQGIRNKVLLLDHYKENPNKNETILRWSLRIPTEIYLKSKNKIKKRFKL